ncbi:MAG: 16S rRNA processing protein RimM [Actinobacteria bacterium]|nr:16S rRNA processing protein RimM [Actinomycetota bacterium]
MPGEAGSIDPVPDLIRIGFAGKAHGVRGGFYVEGAIDPQALAPGLEVLIGDRRFCVVSRQGADARPIVSLEGVGDRDTATELRGLAIFAERGALTPLAEGEWYASDLEGMSVSTAAASGLASLGRVSRLVNLPSVDVLEVESSDHNAVIQIPLVSDAIVGVDLESGVITVDAEFLGLDIPADSVEGGDQSSGE